jgi:hypothetical protein
MHFPRLTAALAALCFALPTTAQDVYNVSGERMASTALAFGGNSMAAMTISYGQPMWKEEYTGMLDKLKGKMNRLGKDFWTTFMTASAVEIGGVKVAAGSYVVGLHCDKDGKLALAFLDASKAMKDGVMPWDQKEWTPDAVCPLTLNKDVAKDSVQKMTMEVKLDEKAPTKGSFTLAWGKHTATAPVAIPAAK